MPQTVNGTTVVPSQATFTLELSQVSAGSPAIVNPHCRFSYTWNFSTNMGLAQLESINGLPTPITLHPLGIEGKLDFMSDLATPYHTVIWGVRITINRVILDIDIETGERSAAILFTRLDGTQVWEYTPNFAGQLN